MAYVGNTIFTEQKLTFRCPTKYFPGMYARTPCWVSDDLKMNQGESAPWLATVTAASDDVI